jgi:hypothetical protein
MNINEFRAGLKNGGARPTLFEVQITNPWISTADSATPLLVKAASLPAYTSGLREIKYMGRTVKYAGDPTFEEWTVTVINDTDFLIRDAMAAWFRAIHPTQDLQNQFGTTSPAAYKSQALIRHFNDIGEVVKTYTFDGIFPTNIGAIETSWESTDATEEFTVTFQYDWFE